MFMFKNIGHQEQFLSAVKHQKHAWYGHVIHHYALSMVIFHGKVKGGQRRRRHRKYRKDNFNE